MSEKMRALWATDGQLIFLRDIVEDALNRAEEPTFRKYIHKIYERLVLVVDKGLVPRETYTGGLSPREFILLDEGDSE